jgi:phage virion morphogenesis protein
MIEFRFSEDLSKRLAAAEKALVDFTPAMAAIADLMRSDAVIAFETETGPDGLRWKPSRRAIEEGGLTLTDTGHLRQSITAVSDNRSATIGTNLIYAAIHQNGGRITPRSGRALRTPAGPRGAVNMPARPFLGFSPASVGAIEDILGRHIAKAMGAPA